MRPSAAPPSLFALFSHERGPAAPARSVALAALRPWPDLWSADPRLLPLIGDDDAEALVRADPRRLRYFSATDPEYPNVPLLRAEAGEATPAREEFAGIRDKLWQRLVVEEAGHFPQPGFAAVNGDRIVAGNAPWEAAVEAVDCRPARADLLSALAPGVVVVLDGADAGFVAIARADGIRMQTRSPHVAARLQGAGSALLSAARWVEFVDALCAAPLPLSVTKAASNPSADLDEALLSAPGSYFLKPRLGSNGVCVARVASAGGRLEVESDCPDTAAYLEEFPRDPALRGRDVVAALATRRGRFIDRALAGLPEWAFGLSILEEEIRQDRADGCLFEPRVVVQRVQYGSTERLVTLGAFCKQIDTAVGASVARGFREEPLEASLGAFLRGRVPGGDLARRVDEARGELLSAADRLRAAVATRVEALGARVHQFAIDCRLCWDPVAARAGFAFLEFQFGIGRVEGDSLGPGLTGYKTRSELAELFGPERR